MSSLMFILWAFLIQLTYVNIYVVEIIKSQKLKTPIFVYMFIGRNFKQSIS